MAKIKNNDTVADIAGGPAVGEGILLPKLTHRWRIIASGEMDDPAMYQQVISCSRPTLTFTEIELPRNSHDGGYGNKVYVAGKHQWEPLTVVIEDDAKGGAARAIQRQLQKQIYVVNDPTADPAEGKFDFHIHSLDGNDDISDIWKLEGCFVQSADFMDLDYSNSDSVKITLTIRFDHARMEICEGV